MCLNRRIKFSSQLIGVLCCMLFIGCTSSIKPHIISVEITNTTEKSLTDVLVELNNEEFITDLNKFDINKISVSIDKTYLPYQLVTNSTTNLIEALLVLCDIDAKETLEIEVREDSEAVNNFEKRTQAELSVKEGGQWEEVVKKSGVHQHEYKGGEFTNINYLRVPDRHSDHTFYIRYEGPGWESDKVAYRFYLDWRNAVDVFGKKTSDMVLQGVGLDGFDSYHEDSDWGMDVLKVGGSLGLGSIGYWDGENALRVALTDSVTCEVSQNGNLRSSITTNYYGWKDSGNSLNLQSILSIDAGSRLTKQHITTSSLIENICTGIVKHEGAELIKSEGNGEWGYIATFGKQSLNNDMLGMSVFYRKADLIEVTEDARSYLVVLLPSNKEVEYQFSAAWEKDLDAVSTKEQFLDYLNLTLDRLNNPILLN